MNAWARWKEASINAEAQVREHLHIERVLLLGRLRDIGFHAAPFCGRDVLWAYLRDAERGGN